MTVEGSYRYAGKDKNIVLIDLFEDDLAINAFSVSNLLLQLIKDSQLKIILNCEQVKRITSSGLGMLVGIYKQIRERGGQLVLLNLFPHIVDIFVETHLSTLFPMFDNKDDAIKALEEGTLNLND